MSPKAERVGLLIVVAFMAATEISLAVGLGLEPWVLIPSLLTVLFALAGPNPRLSPWRDALTVILFLSIFARSFTPPDWPKPLKWSLGAVGAPGISLLFIAYFHADGIGAWMRRISRTRFGEGLRRVSYYSAQLMGLIFSGAPAMYVILQPGVSRAYLLLPLIAVLAGLVPARWKWVSNGFGVLGCLGFLVAVIGAATHAWPWGLVLVYIFAGSASDFVRKLTRPIPPEDVAPHRLPPSTADLNGT